MATGKQREHQRLDSSVPPKGTDLSVHSQEELDAIALELNMRPRKRFDFKCPIEMMGELVAKYHEVATSLQ